MEIVVSHVIAFFSNSEFINDLNVTVEIVLLSTHPAKSTPLENAALKSARHSDCSDGSVAFLE